MEVIGLFFTFAGIMALIDVGIVLFDAFLMKLGDPK